jgi:hypothetical protein
MDGYETQVVFLGVYRRGRSGCSRLLFQVPGEAMFFTAVLSNEDLRKMTVGRRYIISGLERATPAQLASHVVVTLIAKSLDVEIT